MNFPENHYLYQEAIRRRVCKHCLDFGRNGSCYALDPEGCAVQRFLPELVRITRHVNSKTIQPYVEALRSQICAKCSNKKPDGSCPIREAGYCGLNSYLPLAIEAIEEVDR